MKGASQTIDSSRLFSVFTEFSTFEMLEKVLLFPRVLFQHFSVGRRKLQIRVVQLDARIKAILCLHEFGRIQDKLLLGRVRVPMKMFKVSKLPDFGQILEAKPVQQWEFLLTGHAPALESVPQQMGLLPHCFGCAPVDLVVGVAVQKGTALEDGTNHYEDLLLVVLSKAQDVWGARVVYERHAQLKVAKHSPSPAVWQQYVAAEAIVADHVQVLVHGLEDKRQLIIGYCIHLDGSSMHEMTGQQAHC